MCPIHNVKHWRVVFAGGGTGGHVIPGLALAEEVLARDPYADVTFIGTAGGIEEKLVPTFGHRLVLVGERREGMRGPKPLRMARQALAVWRSRRECVRLFRDLHPHVVVGLGGFAAAGPILAARGLGLPTVLMEQNAIPGRANRLLARYADTVMAQFEACRPYFPARSRVDIIGNPVLRSTLEDGGSRILSSRPTLLVVGGSQGARPLNAALAAALPMLRQAAPDLETIALTGEADADLMRTRFQEEGMTGRVVPFTIRMGNLYGYADLVVARAGATTIAELTALGLPSMLVPYPFAADNHQEANARILEEAGAAEVVRQSDLTPALFARRVTELLADQRRLAQMAAAARRLGIPEAAPRAVDRMELMREGALARSA
jgi:UDP-N-acetylglucosamine--N-acetylmuramyl-(pentapeptide) pyrophosphoryl-undecaprenol N-acetylglucosamine transferase